MHIGREVPALFQFHYGTIGSCQRFTEMTGIVIFQFHYGTIGSTLKSVYNLLIFLFQFHYGTIGRIRRPKRKVYLPIFQFHYGTIGSIMFIEWKDEKAISIPLWYDWEWEPNLKYLYSIPDFNSTMVRLGVN